MAQDPRNYDRGTIGGANKNAYRYRTVIQIDLRNFLLCDMIRLLVDMVRCVTEIDAETNDVPSNLLPSQTALTAAAARAAHLIVDHDPRIFADVLASVLLGDQADELLGYHRAHGTHPVLSSARAHVACRSRYTELVSWLGVTMYLTTAAIDQTLETVGGFAPGTEIVTDYMLPSGMRDETGESYASQVMAAAAERGEPWLTFLSPDDMSGLLTAHGFGRAEHVRQRDSIDAAMWNRSDSLRPIELSCLAHATVTGQQRGAPHPARPPLTPSRCAGPTAPGMITARPVTPRAQNRARRGLCPAMPEP
jgi:hypothetical protein